MEPEARIAIQYPDEKDNEFWIIDAAKTAVVLLWSQPWLLRHSTVTQETKDKADQYVREGRPIVILRDGDDMVAKFSDLPFYNGLCDCESMGGRMGAHRKGCPTERLRKYDELVERINDLADNVKSGTEKFMRDYEEAGHGVSRRISGETAALLVEHREMFHKAVVDLLFPEKVSDD